MYTIKGKYTDALITIDTVEESCLAQIHSMVNHPAFTNKMVIMPDTHAGKGSVIGFTMPMPDKLIPNVVGVDVNCGMMSCDIGKFDIDHVALDKYIRDRVPFGMKAHTGKAGYYSIGGVDIRELCRRIGMDADYAMNSIGTLGGGNHFIEIGRSVTTGNLWVTVHTGSRNLGKKVCEYWQKIAVERARSGGESIEEATLRIKHTFPKSEWQKEIVAFRTVFNLNNPKVTGLEYIEGDDAYGYLSDMMICQQYAKMNRYHIMRVILDHFGIMVPDKTVETVHNYINFADNIIRKGAISSYTGVEMVIPLNMRDGILLCTGKSNPEWNYSAPHGAGRLLPRGIAKRTVDLEAFKDSMHGIFSTSVGQGTLDESPMAYKDSKMIEEAIGPTADIIDRILPIHNMKDSEGQDE
jgi:RNA-splicing ligase RtcB